MDTREFRKALEKIAQLSAESVSASSAGDYAIGAQCDDELERITDDLAESYESLLEGLETVNAMVQASAKTRNETGEAILEKAEKIRESLELLGDSFRRTPLHRVEMVVETARNDVRHYLNAIEHFARSIAPGVE